MTAPLNRDRRALLRRITLGLAAAPIALPSRTVLGAGQLPLLSENDPAARALEYVADAQKSSHAAAGALCSNCSVYGGADGSKEGPCTLFPGKFVKAAGWCKSWSGL